MPDFNFPYTDVELTEEVNRIPNNFGLLNALNLAPREAMASRYVRIDFRDGQLVVLAASDPGAPGQMSEADDESGKILVIPHFPHLDAINVGDLSNALQVVNGELVSKTLDSETAKRLATIRAHHAITREYIRMGGLKGLVKDGKGRTLYDLFAVFGITKKVIDFTLGTAGTSILDKCEEVVDHVQTNLKGESMSQIEVITSPSFFGKLIQHPNVEKYWLQTQAAQALAKTERERLGGNWGRVFEFGDILWREYKGTFPVRNSTGAITSEVTVASGYGHAYPAGTMNTFRTYDGPPNHIDRVNTPPSGDEEVFISTKILDHGQGVEFKSQSNSLAVWKQPKCLVEVKTSN